MSEDKQDLGIWNMENEARGYYNALTKAQQRRLLGFSLKTEAGQLLGKIEYLTLEEPVPVFAIQNFEAASERDARDCILQFEKLLQENQKIGYYSNVLNEDQPQTVAFSKVNNWIKILDSYFYLPDNLKDKTSLNEDLAFDITEKLSEITGSLD